MPEAKLTLEAPFPRWFFFSSIFWLKTEFEARETFLVAKKQVKESLRWHPKLLLVASPSGTHCGAFVDHFLHGPRQEPGHYFNLVHLLPASPPLTPS